jgi:hypothetical protein
MSELDPDVAWFVPICVACGWRGAPCRTSWELAAEPVRCPGCGGELSAELWKGPWRQFSLARAAALRARR